MAVKLNQADLQFILEQIKISEAHAAGADLATLIPDPHVPWGLRTVDGTYNSIVAGRENWGAADQIMPRLLDPNFINENDSDTFDPDGPFGPAPAVTNTDYDLPTSVADADPRIISNLIADMSVNNPAAVAAFLANELAVEAFREKHGADPVAPGTIPGSGQQVLTDDDLALIPNIAPDEGLSAPFNAWMTFFGQFFDHGLDLVAKGGSGTVYIPLQPDDPLYVPGGHTNFMVLTRAQNQPGPDGMLGTADDVQEHVNVTTPFVDQNQTYTSHASHQVFLREYTLNAAGDPVATGHLLGNRAPNAAGEYFGVGSKDLGGLTTWAVVKAQAEELLGITLSDVHVHEVPLLATDPYGMFERGPNGYPMVLVEVVQTVGAVSTTSVVKVEGKAGGLDLLNIQVSDLPAGFAIDPLATVEIAALGTRHAFLDDIAHNAVPTGFYDHDGNPGTPLVAIEADVDADTGNFIDMDTRGRKVAYDDELLDRHFITGDGRGNENIGLTAVHHVFHSEHNRLVEQNKKVILETGDIDFINEWLLDDITEIPADTSGLVWDGERIFQAARFGTEMQYQHLVFEEFARKVQPLVDPFVFNSITDVDPSIFAEFAHTVYRFGHSMLTDGVPRILVDEAGNIVPGAGGSHVDEMTLIEAFLNPVEYDRDGSISPEQAAGSIVRAMTQTQGNEIDEFVVSSLRNNLLGLPLDLAAINIARGRDTGVPSLNEARKQLYDASGSTFLKPYENWVDFAANLKNPMSVVNFIAAYGTHPSIAGTLEARREAAMKLVFGDPVLSGSDADAWDNQRAAFLYSDPETSGLNAIDFWIGGLAEKKMEFGGMLGSTFNAVFELQMENLQDGDRFYYLTRTQGQNFLNELEQNSFSKLIMANTDISDPGPDGIRGTSDDIVRNHIGVDSFANYDHVLEIDIARQLEEDPTEINPVFAGLGLKKVLRDNPTTSVDESDSAYYNSLTALLKNHAANGTQTGAVIDATADGNGAAGDTVTWADVVANAARIGVTLTDTDLLDIPVLRVDGYGAPLYKLQPRDDDPVDVANADFEADSLATGTPGVIEDAVRGNYTLSAPSGWTIAGEGGLYAPLDAFSDTDGHDGPAVVWLRNGAILSQDTGHQLVGGVSYTLNFKVGDRTDQTWPGGVARLVATNGTTSTVLATQVLPTPADGLWSSVSFATGAIAADLAGYALRIEIEQDVAGGGNQILIDDIAVAPVAPVLYSSTDAVADVPGYDSAYDPFLRDADGNVVRAGAGVAAVAATPVGDTAIDVAALMQAAGLAGNYLRFLGGEHVVVGGTNDNDIIITDFGDDAIWGDAGDDRIESGAGVDLVNGGAGDDIITDSGDTGDFLKGEDGNDVIANSNGLDIVMGGRGKDVIYGGVDFTEVFAGEGDDFVMGGDDMDFLLGNEGDDWIEGGGGFDTIAGDNSDLFFDSRILGHDVMWAGNDENDFDAESGDDIMVQGESVMRNEGMFGFDWVSFQSMQLDAYADMRIRIFATEQEDILRNRFDKVEALSGWHRNDTLIGDDRVAGAAGEPELGGDTVGANENVFFNDQLTQAGVDRIDGLRELLGSLIDAAPEDFTDQQLEEIVAFESGNILLGGRGSDRLQGNGGDDVIDGNSWLNVGIAIKNAAGETVAQVETMRHVFATGEGEPAWAGKSLFSLLIDRVIGPSQLEIVREIIEEADDDGFDTAVFGGNRVEYNIEGAGLPNPGNLAFWDVDGDGFIKVTHFDPAEADGVTIGIDGTDYLKNIERLEFADGSINAVVGSNSAPVGTVIVSPNRAEVGDILTVDFSGLTDADNTATGGAIVPSSVSVIWEVEEEFQAGTFITFATTNALTVTPEMAGLQVRAIVQYRDRQGVLERVISEPTEMIANDVVPAGTAGADLIIGTNGADVINGLGGDDEIFGMGGADFINGGAGSDIIDGGRGNDTAVFDVAQGAVTFEFDEEGNLEVVNAATGEEDLVISIENFQFTNATLTLAQAQNLAGIIGTDGPDALTGDAEDNFIFGRNGADVLNGLGGDDVLFGEQGADTLNGGAGADILNGGAGQDTLNGDGGADTLNGDGGADTLNGGNGADTLTGGAGNDVVNGDAGNDTIIWNVGDGRDVVNGGANGAAGDTFVVNGDLSTENFAIYGPDRFADISYAGTAEIVVTRNGTIIAELTDIEEIVINTGGGGGLVDTIGDFTPTSLSTSTITINGSAGDDSVDISALNSAHRIVFKSLGGNDTIVGTLRPQDIIELAAGTTRADYETTTANGMTTLSHNGHSISYPSSGQPTFAAAGESGGTGGSGGGLGGFDFTAADLAGIKALVNGQPLRGGDDDDVPTGVRTLSGYGNNEDNPDWGVADEPFIRLTAARYSEPDDNGNRAINPIFKGLDPRAISNALGAQEADLPKAPNDANLFFMSFGQYFDHGLDFVPKGGNGSLPIGGVDVGRPGPTNPADLTRATVHGYDEDGVPQHLNKVSPFVDQNQAYGSHELVGQFLRQGDGSGGLASYLLAGADDPSNPDFSLLPTLRELIQHHWQNNTVFKDPSLPGGEITFRDYYTDYPVSESATGTLFNAVDGSFDPGVMRAMVANFMGSGHALLLDTNPFISLLDHYVAGDGRANENFALTSMHTIWARNHNWHVENLLEAGFEGTEEELFQAAKMINEAEYQRVVFDEFADALLGGMRGSGSHGHDEYNPDATAAISHEFAAAVYRVGHSLIGQTMTVIDANGQPREVPLFDAFLNPTNDAEAFTVDVTAHYTPQPGYEQHGVGSILAGIAQQPAEAVDFNIVDAVRNDLVRISADLFAFNVARGWDLGLGTLNQVRTDLSNSSDPYIREALEHVDDVTAYTSWEDFQDRNGLSDVVIEQFKQAYPDLILEAGEVAAFRAVNPDIELIPESGGRMRVKGIDRVDLWVGGLAERHVNGGMVGQTFWIVLHEQFDRLQEADRFYYTDRFDNFDFYENFVDGQNFSDIVARVTGLEGLPEDIFAVDDEDGDQDGDTDGDDDTDDDGDSETDEDTDEDTDDDGDTDDSDDDADDSDDNAEDGDDETDGGVTQPGSGVIAGTAGADVLMGTAASEILTGMAGDDTIVGNGGDDTIRAGSGDDFASGGAGRDVLLGNAGDDELFGGADEDMLFGGEGDDLIHGDDGDDVVEGGKGEDTVFAGAGDDLILANDGDGSDIYWGEDGNDTLDYAAITADLEIDLGNGMLNRGYVTIAGGDSDTIYGIENVIGGSGDDTIIASNAVNWMDGGQGDDVFRFDSAAAANGDTIVNFRPGDKIDLSNIDANLGTAGNQNFTLIGCGQFTSAGQIRVTHETREDGDYTVVEGSVNDAPEADFKISLTGRHDLNASDFTGLA